MTSNLQLSTGCSGYVRINASSLVFYRMTIIYFILALRKRNGHLDKA